MPCLIALIAVFVPRVTLCFVWLLTHALGRAYQTWYWPLLGFFFLPLTTLAYAWVMISYGKVEGYGLGLIILAALMDTGTFSTGWRARRRRERRWAQ